ncbi:tetratricopeptide repeat protein [Mariniflexile ostreae]|uniref:Tetratricopeptide repeat protein n=1 Tax=Mariniflexile ostreae TaxID=1520892 RepID=A0ABV5FA61_9FLAO
MKKTVLIALLIPFFTFAQANKLFRKAMRTTDLTERIDLLSQAIVEDSQHLDAYFQRALARDQMGDFSAAILDYTKVIFFEPGADSYYNRGNSKYKLMDFMGAKEDYAQALVLDPQFIEARYSLASAKYELKDYEEAIKDLNIVIKLLPEYEGAYRLRGFAYAALDKSLEALRDFSLVILLKPTSDAYFNRGVSYLDINYYQQANDDFSTALKIDKDNSLVYFFKGNSHFLLGEYDQAFLDFNTALGFDTLDYDAVIGLALTYYKTGNLENSKLQFEKAKRILGASSQNKKGIEVFDNTYWFVNQYYVFNENYEKLSRL